MTGCSVDRDDRKLRRRLTVWHIYNITTTQVDITVLRHTGHVADLSVKPVTHYPLLLDDMVRHYR